MNAQRDVHGTTVAARTGDLTQQDVDAIVNAANAQLQHGGGVAAAIVKAGGRTIQRESDAWVDEHGPLSPEQAAVTSGGELPARWVIHVAGPVYGDQEPDESQRLLATAVTAALDAAADAGARSIAFPAISAGVYGYPREEATAVIARTVVDWLEEHRDALDEVRLIGLDDATTQDFADGIEQA